MRTAIVTIRSRAPYSSSKAIESERGDKETPDAFEERTWRERLHVDANGCAFIPGIAFKKALDIAAKRFPTKVKGRGNATYAKFFEAGCMVLENVSLPGVTRASVKGERLFVPSDGKAGGGKRVWRTFPIVHDWSGKVAFTVLDDTITEDVFEKTIPQALAFVGIGRWRPERGGMYGRADVEKVEWK
jgi:hypothetical protein